MERNRPAMLVSSDKINDERHLFPHCIVWTPIFPLTWIFPFIGHMGIATTSGIIRDFAGSHFVSENCMAFGWPTSYWQLNLDNCVNGANGWNKAVADASNVFNQRLHNICWNNCHSHVAMALNLMKYDSKQWNNWNVVFCFFWHSRSVNFTSWCKQWVPSIIFISLIALIFIMWPVLAQG